MMPITAIRDNALLLALFGLLTTAGIAATFQGTKDKIAEQERLAQAKALLEIMPAATHSNDMLDTPVALPDMTALGLRQAEKGYLALDENGTALAVLLPAIARDGYSGDIRLLIGIRSDGNLAGVRAVSHHETPGLGDKIELNKSRWILGFEGKSLLHPTVDKWKVSKDGGDFDAFTGATITPRAVIGAVKRSLSYFEKHKDTLLTPMPESQHD